MSRIGINPVKGFKSVIQFCILQWLTPEGFRSLVALVGTNGQGIGTSPLSRWVRNCDAVEISTEEREKLDQLIDNIYDQLDKGESVLYPPF